MKFNTIDSLRGRIKGLLVIFTVLLVLSGITAFPIQWEMHILEFFTASYASPLQLWINTISDAVTETNKHYPFIFYGDDWLAFAHIVIGIAFLGPIKDPVRNIWIIQWGMIACALVIPLAMICGHIRHIPFYWQIIDCSFGVLGFIPLYTCYKYTRQLEKLISIEKL